jgi:hypothetical protein
MISYKRLNWYQVMMVGCGQVYMAQQLKVIPSLKSTPDSDSNRSYILKRRFCEPAQLLHESDYRCSPNQ